MAETITPTELDWRPFDHSTRASWFWAFMFGPIYFVAHGFWKYAVLLFLLNLLIIGILVAPFLAYPAWRERAKAEAKEERMLRAMERR